LGWGNGHDEEISRAREPLFILANSFRITKTLRGGLPLEKLGNLTKHLVIEPNPAC
jgi:hypothetical protein